jgi:hypothetical protein
LEEALDRGRLEIERTARNMYDQRGMLGSLIFSTAADAILSAAAEGIPVGNNSIEVAARGFQRSQKVSAGLSRPLARSVKDRAQSFA